MILNQLKTFLFFIILTVLALLCGFALGGETGLTIAFIITLILNIFSYWYSDKFILKIYGAKLASYSDYSKLSNIVREVSERAKIKKPKIYIIKKNIPNAFATGRSPAKAAIAVTESLLESLNERELKAVIAHEMAHIKNRDTLISTIVAILTGTIVYVSILARWGMIFGSRNNENSRIFEILILAIVAPIAATILRLAISRSRELIADESGAKMIKDPLALASALEKLENYPHKLKKGNQAMGSLFIINPFQVNFFSKLFSTHPPLHERIKRLKKMSMFES